MRVPPPTRPPGLARVALAVALLAGCGQKGPLVRPSAAGGAPVVIRAPAAPVPAAAPAGPEPAPAAPATTPAKTPGDAADEPPRA